MNRKKLITLLENHLQNNKINGKTEIVFQKNKIITQGTISTLMTTFEEDWNFAVDQSFVALLKSLKSETLTVKHTENLLKIDNQKINTLAMPNINIVKDDCDNQSECKYNLDFFTKDSIDISEPIGINIPLQLKTYTDYSMIYTDDNEPEYFIDKTRLKIIDNIFTKSHWGIQGNRLIINDGQNVLIMSLLNMDFPSFTSVTQLEITHKIELTEWDINEPLHNVHANKKWMQLNIEKDKIVFRTRSVAGEFTSEIACKSEIEDTLYYPYTQMKNFFSLKPDTMNLMEYSEAYMLHACKDGINYIVFPVNPDEF